MERNDEMPKATVNGITMHYQVKGEGPDVILIHGLTSSLALWYTKVAPALADSFRVISYDMRGHGYTDMPERGYTAADLGADLVALMGHLGIDRAGFVGHSFGGAIALYLAAFHPERVNALAVADTGLPALRHLRNIDNWPGWDQWKDQLETYGIDLAWFLSKDKGDAAELIRKSFEIPRQFGMRKGERRGTKRMQRLLDETSMADEFREVAGLTEEKLTSIRAPLLALYGSDSPYQRMGGWLAENLSECCSETLDGSGHFYLLQQPEEFIGKVGSFMRDPHAFHHASRSERRPDSKSPQSHDAGTMSSETRT